MHMVPIFTPGLVDKHQDHPGRLRNPDQPVENNRAGQ
jgi:hypothetical protein